jgi:hypothetical protein
VPIVLPLVGSLDSFASNLLKQKWYEMVSKSIYSSNAWNTQQFTYLQADFCWDWRTETMHTAALVGPGSLCQNHVVHKCLHGW